MFKYRLSTKCKVRGFDISIFNSIVTRSSCTIRQTSLCHVILWCFLGLDDHFIYVNVLKMIKRLWKSFGNRISKSFDFGLWSFSFPDDTGDILWKIYSSPVLKNRSLYKTNSLLFSSWSLFHIHSDYTLWEFKLCAVSFFFSS